MSFMFHPSNEAEMLVFGSISEGIIYKDRSAAYAVVKNVEGKIAAVQSKRGYFLPGGGADAGETPVETVIREVREELGRGVAIDGEIGQVIQYFIADEQPYRMHAVFVAASLMDRLDTDCEYELLWLEPRDFYAGAYHQCHVWAVQQLDEPLK